MCFGALPKELLRSSEPTWDLPGRKALAKDNDDRRITHFLDY